MKDHLIAQMHNNLRDTALKFTFAEQLRARLARVIAPLVYENKQQAERIDSLEREIRIRDCNYG